MSDVTPSPGLFTFRPLNLETDAADMARINNCTVPEPITEATAREWWTLRQDEFRATMLAFDEHGTAIGYWDVNHETWMKPGHL